VKFNFPSDSLDGEIVDCLIRGLVRLTIVLAIAASAFASAGCSLVRHHETPQQQFTEALSRGNSAQASYIWNNMNAQDRASFRRGEGLKPQVDQGAIAEQIEQHQHGEAGGGDDDPPASLEIPGNE
jgi:hypothetical protein